MTIDEIKLLYQHLSEMTIHFDRMNHSPEAIKSWAKFLSDLEFNDVAAAIREHIKYDEKTPTVAKIRKRAQDIKAARIKESKAVRAGDITYYNPPAPVSDGLTPEKCKAYLEKRAALKAIPQTPAKPSAERIAAFERNRLEAIEIMKRKLGESQ